MLAPIHGRRRDRTPERSGYRIERDTRMRLSVSVHTETGKISNYGSEIEEEIYSIERRSIDADSVVRWLRYIADGIEADLEASSPTPQGRFDNGSGLYINIPGVRGVEMGVDVVGVDEAEDEQEDDD